MLENPDAGGRPYADEYDTVRYKTNGLLADDYSASYLDRIVIYAGCQLVYSRRAPFGNIIFFPTLMAAIDLQSECPVPFPECFFLKKTFYESHLVKKAPYLITVRSMFPLSHTCSCIGSQTADISSD